MVPAVVLLDAEGRVLRRSMQQNDARALPEIDAMAARVDPEALPRRHRRQRQPADRGPEAALARSITSPRSLPRIATIFGSYDYITYRLTGARSVDHNWALESGLMDIRRREFVGRAAGRGRHRARPAAADPRLP